MWPTVDTVLNDEFFGRPGVSKGENSALPQARLVALPECGPTRSSTRRSARARHQNLVCRSWSIGSSHAWCCSPTAASPGSPYGNRPQRPALNLLWRAKNNVTPRQIEVFADGSWLGEMDSPTPE